MQPNPYQPPSTGSESPPAMRRWVCLIGLALMIASVLGLVGAGSFQGGMVTYRYAVVPILLAALFCIGGAAFFGGGLLWLFSRKGSRKT